VIFLSKIFCHPFGKQVTWTIPHWLLSSPKEIKKWFIRGFYDSEGGCGRVETVFPRYPWQSQHKIKIYLSSFNKRCEVLECLKIILKNDFNINSEVKRYRSSNNRSKLNTFYLEIKNIKDKLKFIDKIGSSHPEKLRHLNFLKRMILNSYKFAVGAESSKESVTAHTPRSSAEKMDGTKPAADTSGVQMKICTR